MTKKEIINEICTIINLYPECTFKNKSFNERETKQQLMKTLNNVKDAVTKYEHYKSILSYWESHQDEKNAIINDYESLKQKCADENSIMMEKAKKFVEKNLLLDADHFKVTNIYIGGFYISYIDKYGQSNPSNMFEVMFKKAYDDTEEDTINIITRNTGYIDLSSEDANDKENILLELAYFIKEKEKVEQLKNIFKFHYPIINELYDELYLLEKQMTWKK